MATIVDLEKAWLDAETKADLAKRAASRATEELARKNAKAAGAEIKVLISTVEQAKAEQAAAERRASDAFDRLWKAKTGDGKGEVSAFA